MRSTDQTPAVFVHGLIGTLEHLIDPAPFDPRPIIAPALLGYGRYSGAAPPITLDRQVEHLRDMVVDRLGVRPVHLVGHSVGGAIAALFAFRHPELVASLISVEGNFTLKDAFWSSGVARMALREVEAMLDNFRSDPAGWLAGANLPPRPDYLARATRCLRDQTARALQNQAKAVVEATGRADYLDAVRSVFARTPVHLVAGAFSRAGWDTPDWAMAQAAGTTILPGRGHIMMLEDPAEFSGIVERILRNQER